MQIVSTSPNISPPATAKSSREPVRAGVQPVEPVDEEPLRDAPREDVLEPSERPEELEKPQVEAESYRLNFDEEKRRLYLELLNPVTGDVIQRVPRDDLAFAFAADEDATPPGVNISI